MKKLSILLMTLLTLVLLSGFANAAPPLTYYMDADGDGYGDPNVRKKFHPPPPTLPPPAQWVLDNTDCDDTNASINPATIWYKDVDGDGYSDGSTQGPQCVRPADHYYAGELIATSGDCDDNDNITYPGATEVCGDGKDNNCDGQINEFCDLSVPEEFATIQEALNNVSDGYNIFVNDGTYYENINFIGKAATLQSVNGAAVTTIDGGANGSVVTFESGEGVDSVLDGFTITNGSGTVHPIYSSQYNGGGIYCNANAADASPTITNCNITGNSALNGGGIACYANYTFSASPTITNCNITNNTGQATGGIWCYTWNILQSNAAPTIDNSHIDNNIGLGLYLNSRGPAPVNVTNSSINNNTSNYANYAGGIYSTPYVSVHTFTNCDISGNSGYYGGGAQCMGQGDIIFNNCTFNNNQGQQGSGIYMKSASSVIVTGSIFNANTGTSGTIYIHSSDPFISNSIFTNNTQVAGGAIFADYNSAPTITDCEMIGNSAQYQGGALLVMNSSAVVSRCDIRNNSADMGGAIDVSGDYLGVPPEFTNCNIVGNMAPATIYNNGGGAIFTHTGNPRFVNCTIADNFTGAKGGAVLVYYISGRVAYPEFINTIFWNNTAVSGGNEVYVTNPANNIDISYSDIDPLGIEGDGGWFLFETFFLDPLFNKDELSPYVNKDEYYIITNSDRPEFLGQDSPCIDAGTDIGAPFDDISGIIRPQGLGYDIGAYENDGLEQ
jgi:hypothetical protein